MGLPWREREKIGHKEGPLGRAESRELDRDRSLGEQFCFAYMEAGSYVEISKGTLLPISSSIPRASPGLRMPLVCGSSVVCHPLSVPTFK